MRRPTRTMLIWLVPIFLTIHNAEEAFAFSRMRASFAAVLPQPFARLESQMSQAAFVLALAVLSVIAFVIAGLAARRPNDRVVLWVLLALETAVLINAVAHVVSALLVFHGYGPGLFTAIFVNAPFGVYLLGRVKREEWLGPRAWSSLGIGGVVLHGPILLGALWLASR